MEKDRAMKDKIRRYSATKQGNGFHTGQGSSHTLAQFKIDASLLYAFYISYS